MIPKPKYSLMEQSIPLPLQRPLKKAVARLMTKATPAASCQTMHLFNCNTGKL